MSKKMTAAELKAVRARHEAATPGPYEWDVRPDSHSVLLESKRSMAPVVMAFERWGMTGAAPAFVVGGIIRHVKELLSPIPGREHHKWVKRIVHPDAIALEKSWEDREALLGHIDALEEQLQACRDEVIRMEGSPLRAMGGYFGLAPEGSQ